MKRPYDDEDEYGYGYKDSGGGNPEGMLGTPFDVKKRQLEDDKGLHKPIWKQDARDEKGRKRFHGAFTGGFSAGYNNTAGSFEGTVRNRHA